MLPTREKAMELLLEGESRNPGPWKMHSVVVAECAARIAKRTPGMDPDKAYVLGLLHDIGRRFGISYLAHVIDGYDYMTDLGYAEAARICLTHSFCTGELSGYIGKWDISQEQIRKIEMLLEQSAFDDYDRLMQLCDSMALPGGPADIEARMSDVKRRYGEYPEAKWEKHLELKRYFEEKMGEDLYEAVGCERKGKLVELKPYTRERCYEFRKDYKEDPDRWERECGKEKEKTDDYYEKKVLDRNRRFLAVMREGAVIGEIQLGALDLEQGCGTLSILLKGDSEKNREYETEAELLMLDYAVHELALSVVYADMVLQSGRRQQELEKLGFEFLREAKGRRYYQWKAGER